MEQLMGYGITAIVLAVLAFFSFTFGLYILRLRRVVPTNEVHILQTRNATTSYGKGQASGNTYYEWPSWLPVIGLTKTVFPVSVFEVALDGYDAYDKERVPFLVDVVAFMRIDDPNTAAQRIANFGELMEQLEAIVRGAVRTVLANHEIDQIMIERSRFGEYFTNEVESQLKQWGVVNVKNIELMDIRDARNSEVIANIMAKRTSAIERDSRVTVAENKRAAKEAEIVAQRQVDLSSEQARQQVGERKAEAEKVIGVSQQRAVQEIKIEEKETMARAMEVQKVEQVKTAEIEKEVQVVKAEEHKQTAVIAADGDKQRTILLAEGKLEETKKAAEGIRAEGDAKAAAEAAILLAPVTAQITLAKEIGENQPYQQYLLTIEQIKANQAVGIEQAQALQSADIKVITNAGAPAEGLTNVMDLFSSKGGTAVASLLEGLAQSEAGKKVVDRVTGNADA